jgi:hypothetical protein
MGGVSAYKTAVGSAGHKISTYAGGTSGRGGEEGRALLANFFRYLCLRRLEVCAEVEVGLFLHFELAADVHHTSTQI